MGRGLGAVQQDALEYLGTLSGWAARAGRVAMHVFGLDWRPSFTSSEYQTTARALRTLAKRGLVERTSPGIYRVPQPGERRLQFREFKPDPELEEIASRRKEAQKRVELLLKSLES